MAYNQLGWRKQLALAGFIVLLMVAGGSLAGGGGFVTAGLAAVGTMIALEALGAVPAPEVIQVDEGPC